MEPLAIRSRSNRVDHCASTSTLETTSHDPVMAIPVRSNIIRFINRDRNSRPSLLWSTSLILELSHPPLGDKAKELVGIIS